MGTKQAKITRQTFLELGLLLSSNTKPTDIDHDLIIKLQTEELYLPIIELSNQYWLTSSLCYRLKKLKVFAQLPHILQQYLNEVSSLYRQRNVDIKNEAKSVCQLLNDHGIKQVLLKGAASLFNSTYPSPGMRYMCDIDILVSEEQQQQAFELLLGNGYQTDENPFAIHSVNHHHAPSLCLPNSLCRIEIHKNALKYPASNVLTDEQIFKSLQPLTLDKQLNVAQLNPTQQIIMCIAHSEISHSGYSEKQLDLRQFYHLHCLIAHFDEDIDWRLVEKHFQLADQEKVLHAALQGVLLLFNSETAITRNYSKSNQHIERRMQLFCNQSWLRSFWYKLRRLLSGYSAGQIAFTYDVSGFTGVLQGRLKHFSRHLKMLFNKDSRQDFWAGS
ncbi:nucleotidyltransferase family protein [Thalassotalea sp. PS06]|uniref:nucleotidyltransferase family protein n=1 Tax=Thalassotalea sp. PS06 TaxID=2594005 RepID=UPI00116378D8|nr:nucleotidyltransferase family protein [Thalassotalea sp. PS06]QDP00649.1 nucleotidyltransferase family protein [Thalassotalea sp. PS06]